MQGTPGNYDLGELTTLLRIHATPEDTQPSPPQTPVAPKEGHTEPPPCPKCGTPMVLRTAKRGSNAGTQFWGCPNYPRCHGIRQTEEDL